MALGGLWSRASGLLIGFGLSRTAGTAFAPIFELLRQEAWYKNANAILSPQVLAQLVAQAVTDYGPAQQLAQREGLDAEQFRALVEYYLNGPQLGMALQALQRGTITEAQYRHALSKQGIEPQYHDAMVQLRHYLVPPSDLVRMAVREAFDQGQRDALDLDAEYPGAVTAKAADLGISEATMRDYWAAHWDLPSYTQATEMLFRGEIDRGKFQRLLRALDYAPTWRGPLEAIARRIPTPTDYLRLVRRGVYTASERQAFQLDAEYPPVFTEKMGLHGMIEQDARDLWAGGWRLPSARQLYQMLWRHEIDAGQLNIGLRALDYPIFWRQRLANIARPVPPRVAIASMLRAGVVTPAEGKEMFMQLGYSDLNADRLVQIALPTAAGDATAASWAGRARSRLFTTARTEYLDGSISSDRALELIEYVGATSAEAGLVLAMWNQEASIRRKELTPAQIKKAHRSAIYDTPTALYELEQRGYSPDDAQTYLES